MQVMKILDGILIVAVSDRDVYCESCCMAVWASAGKCDINSLESSRLASSKISPRNGGGKI